jgi:hypothetical protein
MSSAIRKIRRKQERKVGGSPLKAIEGLTQLQGLTELAPRINEFILAAEKMEGMVEDLQGVEGLIESVVEVKNTFESLVNRQNQCELALKEILQLLHQERVGPNIKGFEDLLVDYPKLF